MKQRFAKYKKQDTRVQLARLLACLMVIGCHARPAAIRGADVSQTLLFLDGFTDDGVAIFFCITGFFLFSQRSFKTLAKRTFFTIVVPTLLLMLTTDLLLGWVLGERSLFDCLIYPDVDLLTFIGNAFKLTPGAGELCFHLWYITAYLGIVVLFPILRLLCADNEKARFALNWTLFLGSVSLLLSDVQAWILPPWGTPIVALKAFETPIFLVLLGYVIYQNKEKVLGNVKLRWACFLGAIGINVIRYLLQSRLYQYDLGNNYFYFWNTGIAAVFTVCVLVFFFTFQVRTVKTNVMVVVNYLGSQTFIIYLVHVLVLFKLESLGFTEVLSNFFFGGGITPLGGVGYMAVLVSGVFLISLITTIVINQIKAAVKSIFFFAAKINKVPVRH